MITVVKMARKTVPINFQKWYNTD